MSLRAGVAVQLLPVAAAPSKGAANGQLWINSAASNALYYTNPAGTSAAVGGGGGGTTQTIDVINATAATGKQLTSAVANSGTNVAFIFDNSTTLSGTTKLASWRNNTAEKLAVDYSGALLSPTTLSLQGATGGVFAITQGADGASAKALTVTNSASWSNAGARLMSLQNNFVEALGVRPSGDVITSNTTQSFYVSGDSAPQITLDSGFGAGVPSLKFGTSASSYYIYAASGTVAINAGSTRVGLLDTVAWQPSVDLNIASGQSANRWTETWSRRYAGVEQTVAAAASITLNPALGETIRVTLSATGITTVNGSAGFPGETMRVEVIQDATGSRTITGWSTGTNGFLLAGGTYTPTATLNKRDLLTFAWDATAAKWVEQSRSLNL